MYGTYLLDDTAYCTVLRTYLPVPYEEIFAENSETQWRVEIINRRHLTTTILIETIRIGAGPQLFSPDLLIWVGFEAAMRFKRINKKSISTCCCFYGSTERYKEHLHEMCNRRLHKYHISIILPLLLIPSSSE